MKHLNTDLLGGKYTHFGCDEEVLGRCLFAGCADNNVKDSSLIYRIHSLHREEAQT